MSDKTRIILTLILAALIVSVLSVSAIVELNNSPIASQNSTTPCICDCDSLEKSPPIVLIEDWQNYYEFVDPMSKSEFEKRIKFRLSDFVISGNIVAFQGIHKIPSRAFIDVKMRRLKSHATEIGSRAFMNTGLEYADIYGANKIREHAFDGHRLSFLNMSPLLEVIEPYALRGSGYVGILELPKNLKKLGNGSFERFNFNSLVYKGDMPHFGDSPELNNIFTGIPIARDRDICVPERWFTNRETRGVATMDMDLIVLRNSSNFNINCSN